MDQEFRRQAFEGADSALRSLLCHRLAEAVRARLATAGKFHDCVYGIVEELRQLGHDLWSIDEGDDFQVWGPDYGKPAQSGLLIHFEAEGPIDVEWLQR